MTPLQVRTIARLAVRDLIQKMRNARTDILELQARMTTLETKVANMKATQIDHEARIVALEGGP